MTFWLHSITDIKSWVWSLTQQYQNSLQARKLPSQMLPVDIMIERKYNHTGQPEFTWRILSAFTLRVRKLESSEPDAEELGLRVCPSRFCRCLKTGHDQNHGPLSCSKGSLAFAHQVRLMTQPVAPCESYGWSQLQPRRFLIHHLL